MSPWFKDLDRTKISRVRIGNGDCIEVKGKGTVATDTGSCIEHIPDVLFVLEIDQNLINIGQLLEKDHYVVF